MGGSRFFRRMWEEGFLTYDELREPGWERQYVEGSMVKAPLAQEAVGNNSTDRGKRRDETKCGGRITRVTRGVVISGANRYAIKQLEAALQSLKTAHNRGRGEEREEKEVIRSINHGGGW